MTARPATVQQTLLGLAALNVRDAIAELAHLRERYRQSNLPPVLIGARVAGLNRKIAALDAVMLDGQAAPWVGDVL